MLSVFTDLVKIWRSIKEDRKANIIAFFIDCGKQIKLRISNTGQHPANNVRIKFPNGNQILNQYKVNKIFPLEALDRHQSVDIEAIVGLSTPPKHEIQIFWKDGLSKDNTKTLFPTLP